MKKVLIISNMYPTPEHISYGIFVKNQVEQLQAQEVETLLAVNADPAKGKVNVLKKYVRWMRDAVKLAKKHKKDLTITHAHYVFPSGLISLYLKKRFNIPYIVTAHGGDINKMAKKNPQIRKLTASILANADHVIAVGEELAQTIEQDFSIDKNNISVMSMGIDRQVFYEAEDKKQVQQSLHMNPDVKNFVFVGNVIQEKGVEELIVAFNALTAQSPGQAALYIIGSTKDRAFFEKISPLAAANTAITFIDPMPQQQLVSYFQAADVFVLPSYIEGLGLVALEAMACGAPVIASDVGGLHYMLKGGAGVLVQPKNADALLGAMQQAVTQGVTTNKKEVQQLLALHDAQYIIERLLQLYDVYGSKGGAR